MEATVTGPLEVKWMLYNTAYDHLRVRVIVRARLRVGRRRLQTHTSVVTDVASLEVLSVVGAVMNEVLEARNRLEEQLGCELRVQSTRCWRHPSSWDFRELAGGDDPKVNVAPYNETRQLLHAFGLLQDWDVEGDAPLPERPMGHRAQRIGQF